jgi:hypothetical protein
MAMVGQGPRAVFLCNAADLSRHRRRVEDIAARDLARMAAKDPATGGLLSGPSTAMRRRTHPFPSHANTLPKWGRRKKHHAPFSPHCKSAGKAAVAVARDQVDELGAALAPFPHDLAAVDRLQLDTMGDADDGCAGLRG